MLYRYIVIGFLFSMGVHAQKKQNTFREAFKASLVIVSDVSYEFKNEAFQKSEIILKPEFSYRLNRNSKFVLKSQLYTELNDNLERGFSEDDMASDFSKRLFIGDRTNLELREFFFYTNFKNKLRLTIGKQQIVWGETDGLKLLDVVNPQNFREFILDDFEDSRIPLWSIKAEFDIKNINVQFVWIPDNTYHITQDFDAPFFTKNLFQSPPEGIPVVINETEKPQHFLNDSDIGFKLNTFTKGWDLSLNYFYYYDDLPVFYNVLQITDTNNPYVTISPKFERQHLIGGTFNKVFGSSTFRGEIAYIFNQNFPSINPNATHGIESSNLFKSAIGIDYIKGEQIISVQLFNDLITDAISPYNRDLFETNMSLKISRDMMNDALNTEVLWVQNVNHGDGYVKPQISYWANTNTQLFLGSSFFYGNESNLFGQFKDRSRISFGIRWGI
ncbi:DUF1302 family protein [Flavivirga algicola]|uniref:DUF5723 domain-containing protein n=1 Tax=Flavivirga algicola TaxID=2729136 RepID=A0ABX1S5X5_9FLAO|nr:DUF1302 family protein [Flavivirga algicola]NMH89839.1 hypothetical protein [Flavivirga algicola]